MNSEQPTNGSEQTEETSVRRSFTPSVFPYVDMPKYNGWANKLTWLIPLHLNNEEGSYRYWQSVAEECKENFELLGLDEGETELSPEDKETALHEATQEFLRRIKSDLLAGMSHYLTAACVGRVVGST